jgi:Flp pilus assembly protein CpaB
MKPIRMICFLVTLAAIFSLASIALARGAPPTKEKSIHQAIAVETTAPTVAKVPLMTGYDVIQNISEVPRDYNARHLPTITTVKMGLSTTDAWRSISSGFASRARSAPRLVMLA